MTNGLQYFSFIDRNIDVDKTYKNFNYLHEVSYFIIM